MSPFPITPADILIVDDTPANLRLLTKILADKGYRTRPVTNGMRAIAAALAGPPDLILLDIGMPEMDGYQVCEQIKSHEQTRDIPIIFISALSSTEDKVKAFQAGGVDYITKPFEVEEVLARVKTHLALRSLSKDLEQSVATRTRELLSLNAALERFVPREFLNLLQKSSVADFRLGDQVQQEMTILFADIRDFTSMSERMSPQENFSFINSYLSRVSPVIRKHHGFIDKYLGDGIMALFPGPSDDALQAAVAVQQEVAIYNQHRRSSGYQPITIGVGLHTGSLMLGIIGEEQRLQSTVISDAVNIASRMEDVSKFFSTAIVTDRSTIYRLQQPEDHPNRFLGRVQVKGKQEALDVFEVFGEWDSLAALKEKTRSNFEAGVRCYFEKQFTEAEVYLTRVVEQSPQDKTAQLYLKRAAVFKTRGVLPEWDGSILVT